MKAIELIEKYRSEVLAKKPYSMNLIELLHANENAHTRILVELLRYNHSDSNFKFAKSFLRKFVRELVDLGVPEVREQEEYIDAIIGEKGKYAVVVENKINWATDQTGQAERYLLSAKELFSIEDGKLYFIYLTDNGKKEVSDISLTKKAREMLGIGDNEGEGRYIKLNYRDHILPWIKKDVLPCCLFGEVQTISALEQYADYLESRLVNSVRQDPNEELFIESCCSYKLSTEERYNLFGTFSELLDPDLPQGSGVDLGYARDELRALIERKMEALHDADFALDDERAVSKIVERILEWRTESLGPGPGRQKEFVVIAQIDSGEASRLVFAVNVEKDRRIEVEFYDVEHKGVLEKLCPHLVEEFSRLFGEPTSEKYPDCIATYLDVVENRSKLDEVLKQKIGPFAQRLIDEREA